MWNTLIKPTTQGWSYFNIKVYLWWAITPEINTPPVEDCVQIFHTVSVDFKCDITLQHIRLTLLLILPEDNLVLSCHFCIALFLNCSKSLCRLAKWSSKSDSSIFLLVPCDFLRLFPPFCFLTLLSVTSSSLKISSSSLGISSSSLGISSSSLQLWNKTTIIVFTSRSPQLPFWTSTNKQ